MHAVGEEHTRSSYASGRPKGGSPRGMAGGVLALQRLAGNRAVAGLRAVQREGAGDEEAAGSGQAEPTVDEEKELLQASGIPVQRAYNARRQLAPLSFLGKPWVKRTKDNLVNMRLYHEHLFFEDGGDDTAVAAEQWTNVGHMGNTGLGRDLPSNGYSKVRTGLNDAKVRQAVAHVRGDGTTAPGKYNLFTNNCQDFVQKVLARYDSTP